MSEELIRKSDVLEIFEDVIYDMEDDCDITVLNMAKKIVEDMSPTAVQDVRHSHWQYYGYIGDSNYFKCCNCGEIQKKDTNYCPNCGAKMDKE